MINLQIYRQTFYDAWFTHDWRINLPFNGYLIIWGSKLKLTLRAFDQKFKLQLKGKNNRWTMLHAQYSSHLNMAAMPFCRMDQFPKMQMQMQTALPGQMYAPHAFEGSAIIIFFTYFIIYIFTLFNKWVLNFTAM